MNLLKLILLGAILSLSGCAVFSGSKAPQLVAPSQVQTDVYNAATIAKPYLTAQQIADISSLKTAVQSLANGSLPVAQFEALISAKLPSATAPALAAVLSAASGVFDAAYNYYGVGNSLFTQYCTAFSQGLTAAGY